MEGRMSEPTGQESEHYMSENTTSNEESSETTEVFTTSAVEEVKAESPTPSSLKKKPAPPAPTIPKDDVEDKIEHAELSSIEAGIAPAPVVEEEAVPSPDGEVNVSMTALCWSPTKRNSGSVILLQERLAEVGYPDAKADMRGWYHDHTKQAVAEWQKANGLDATGLLDPDQAKRLFSGTPVVVGV